MEPDSSFGSGLEWVIDARGCAAASLASPAALQRLFDTFVQGMQLHAAAPAQWHQFPGTGGITGMLLLKESHLTVHTFPENGALCLNLFCCRRRTAGTFDAWLGEFHPRDVSVRLIERDVAGAEAQRQESIDPAGTEAHRSVEAADGWPTRASAAGQGACPTLAAQSEQESTR